MDTSDTIVAISSAIGVGARMIVRLSGQNARQLARAQIDRTPSQATSSTDAMPDLPELTAGAHRERLRICDISVPSQLLVFAAPKSVTGDDVVEFHMPGSVVLARMLMDELISAGARAAQAGEFTARAYFNGKLDLTEVEGVAASIASGNESELQASRRLASGELTARLKPITNLVAETLALIEAGIDFSDEGISFLARNEVQSRLDSQEQNLRDLMAMSTRLEKLSHECRIVLAGRPNSGKSTLLNALSNRARAIVSGEAGTTRDALSAQVALPGGMVTVVDVAGLDGSALEPPSMTQDGSDHQRDIESQMRSRALREITRADVVVLVQELGDTREPIHLPVTPNLTVRTKCDRREKIPNVLCISARTGEGLDDLKLELSKLVFERDSIGDLTLNARHVRLLTDACDAIARAQSALDTGPEFVALELRIALDRLGEVTGAITPDDVLGRIFATFCIGK